MVRTPALAGGIYNAGPRRVGLTREPEGVMKARVYLIEGGDTFYWERGSDVIEWRSGKTFSGEIPAGVHDVGRRARGKLPNYGRRAAPPRKLRLLKKALQAQTES